MSNELNKNETSPVEDQFISELLDDECSAESIDKILTEKCHQETWYRYNQVSAILRKEDSAFCSYEFTQSIAARIAEEPAIIAQPKSASPVTSSKVIQLFKRTGGGLAIAASVAYAMIFSVELISTNNEQNFGTPLEVASSEAPAGIDISNTIISAAEAEEQAKLDEIQNILRQLRRADRNVYEQQVGGEFIVSKVIPVNQLEEMQMRVRNMKKPSEVEGTVSQ